MAEQSPPQSLNVLIVDDELNVRKTLTMSLETDGHTVVAVSNGRDAVDESARQSFDMAFVDLRLGNELGIELVPALLGQSPWMRVVIITAHGSIDSAVETMRRGASDYLTKPFTPAQVRLVTERVSQLRALEQKVAGLEGLRDQDAESIAAKSNSPLMQRALNLARQLAPRNTTVLVRGESGTGKGVLARLIHSWSDRSAKPFATISCPTMSPQLLESELFGHTKGAFTGAARENAGRIASADGGTFFLDEIGDLPLDLQPKLLRFVQDHEYERVGDPVTRHADVRIIAATNVDLDQAVAEGRFREDLLYRINVVQIDLPPLRDRPEDILQLAEGFLVELGREKGQRNSAVGFTPEAQAALLAYRWPGNIRELRNVVERAIILCQGDRVGLDHLPGNLIGLANGPVAMEVGDPISLDALDEVHIRRVLAKSKSLEEAARVLGIDIATLWRRRKKYGI
jgi:two-component system, NtrC family, response regulator AlgB